MVFFVFDLDQQATLIINKTAVSFILTGYDAFRFNETRCATLQLLQQIQHEIVIP